MSKKNMEVNNRVQNRYTEALEYLHPTEEAEEPDAFKEDEKTSFYLNKHRGAFKDKRDPEEGEPSVASGEQQHEEDKSNKSHKPGFIKRLFGFGGSG